MENKYVVSQFINSKGNAVKNQFVLTNTMDNSIIFQSYDSEICEIKYYSDGVDFITLFKNWNYSATTSKYLYQFLDKYANVGGMNKKIITSALEKPNKFLTDVNGNEIELFFR